MFSKWSLKRTKTSWIHICLNWFGCNYTLSMPWYRNVLEYKRHFVFLILKTNHTFYSRNHWKKNVLIFGAVLWLLFSYANMLGGQWVYLYSLGSVRVLFWESFIWVFDHFEVTINSEINVFSYTSYDHRLRFFDCCYAIWWKQHYFITICFSSCYIRK